MRLITINFYYLNFQKLLNLGFVIILVMINVKSQNSTNTNSNNTNSNLNCTQISNPSDFNSCVSKSLNSQTCCFNKNQNENSPNNCALQQNSIINILNGTTLRTESGNFTQICLQPSGIGKIPSTCGKENPVVYTDCLITSSSNQNNNYYCCYSKLTISGTSKTECISTIKTDNMVLSYNSGGIDYKCMNSLTFANSTIVKTCFLLILFILFII